MSDKFLDKYRIPSARAEWWDYRVAAAYFVTICTAGREHYFGEILDEKMHLSEIGQIVHQNWQEIPTHFPFIQLNAFVAMPNHVHGILVIDHSFDIANDDLVETLHATSLHQPPQIIDQPVKNEAMAAISPKRGSLSSVIRSYKSSVSKQARYFHANFAWQTRFHDHIIRDGQEYWKIREYIRNNPKRWTEDKYNQPDAP